VISGKKYTAKVSEASSFCPVPVNLNWYIYFDKSPNNFIHKSPAHKNKVACLNFIKISQIHFGEFSES